VNTSLKLTYERVKFLKNPNHEDPHIKLLIIDLINYLMSTLPLSDRRVLVKEFSELYAEKKNNEVHKTDVLEAPRVENI
jgi:hypothetical protein